jgi:hypothetical protein
MGVAFGNSVQSITARHVLLLLLLLPQAQAPTPARSHGLCSVTRLPHTAPATHMSTHTPRKLLLCVVLHTSGTAVAARQPQQLRNVSDATTTQSANHHHHHNNDNNNDKKNNIQVCVNQAVMPA